MFFCIASASLFTDMNRDQRLIYTSFPCNPLDFY
eukprot:COSAG02_NODE_70352_length_196_cov_42.690722_1_plen_33_part_10